MDATSDTENPKLPTTFNEWFLALPAGRQTVLREDRWMLAEAAFAAAREIGRSEIDELVDYRFVARRDDDGSAWAGQYFEASGCAYAHEASISAAHKAKSVERLKSALVDKMCRHGTDGEQCRGRYVILKVAKNRIDETVETGFVPAEATVADAA